MVFLWARRVVLLDRRGSVLKPWTLEQLLISIFPADLTAAKKGNCVAWALNQEGRRNIWVAEGPSFAARQLTKYNQDDGQELSGVNFSADGNTIAYERGEAKNAAGQRPNPTSDPAGTEQAVWTVPWDGGDPQRRGAGHSPDI